MQCRSGAGGCSLGRPVIGANGARDELRRAGRVPGEQQRTHAAFPQVGTQASVGRPVRHSQPPKVSTAIASTAGMNMRESRSTVRSTEAGLAAACSTVRTDGH